MDPFRTKKDFIPVVWLLPDVKTLAPEPGDEKLAEDFGTRHLDVSHRSRRGRGRLP